jgi:hypothetical protein
MIPIETGKSDTFFSTVFFKDFQCFALIFYHPNIFPLNIIQITDVSNSQAAQPKRYHFF